MAVDTQSSIELQARVQDYLNDQIQTVADLDGINALLLRVQEQQQLLQKQLEDARVERQEAEKIAQSQTNFLRERATEFQQQQQELDRRLKDFVNSDNNEDAVQKFESHMKKVRRLDIATGYIELFQEVDKLRTDATKSLERDPYHALSCYTRLSAITHNILEAQMQAEGAAPHLVDYVQQQTKITREEIKNGLTKDFQSTLEKIKWPQKELNLLGGISKTLSAQVERLLELQEPELLDRAKSSNPEQREPQQLLPLEIMVQPLGQRFRYHFFGERPTNRLDKPEYFLSHILDLLDRHSAFIAEILQPALDARLEINEQLENIYTDAVSSFITALLPLVVAKCLSILPQLSSHPQLISHFMHELMSFDETLRELWNYTPIPGVFTDWRGITWEILNNHNYFYTWLTVEKDFALARYKDIRDASDATDIDYEGVEIDDTKPTKGTIRVNDLLETVTDRYRSLSSFSQKMKFLIDVQLSIFDDYHNFLYAALQAYLASSHTAGRLLQGQSKSEALGQRGLASLCKVFGSAAFLERKMSDWSDDIFFVELWEELQERARANTDSIGHDLLLNDVAAKTSSTITKGEDELLEGGALFDETAAAYRRLKEQSEGEILRLLDINVRDGIFPFTQVDTWSSLSGTVSNPADLAPSANLDSLLQTITSLLNFLRKVLAPAPLRKMLLHICHTIQHDVYDHVILRHTFSAAGVSQLKRDISAIEQAIDRVAGAPQGFAAASMKKLHQVTQLLGLPIKPSSSSITSRSQPRPSTDNGDKDEVDDDGWGFGDAEDEDSDNSTTATPPIALEDFISFSDNADDGESEEGDGREWGLWEAERALFKSNEEARRALRAMGLGLLNESEARRVVKRRVEIES